MGSSWELIDGLWPISSHSQNSGDVWRSNIAFHCFFPKKGDYIQVTFLIGDALS